jgi:hypothetical protein
MFPPRLQRWVAAAAAPSWNPQNTTGAQVLPSADFSPEAAVRTQMDALAKCDEPFPGHGLQLMYEWGYDTGGMEPSMYFAFPKDLYHEDHFVVSGPTHVAFAFVLRASLTPRADAGLLRTGPVSESAARARQRAELRD